MPKQNLFLDSTKDHPFDRRSFLCDAENLAEGGLQDFIENLQPILEKLKIATPTIKQDARDEQASLGWGITTLEMLTIINKLLETNKKKERAFVLYPGTNYQIMVILTPDELKLLTKWGKEAPFGQEDLADEIKDK